MALPNPDQFLRSIIGPLWARGQTDPSLKPIALCFLLSSAAVLSRCNLAGDCAKAFQAAALEPASMDRQEEENNALFCFFTAALSALESFCFATYFAGAAVNRTGFPYYSKPYKIEPCETCDHYNICFPSHPFTASLKKLLASAEYEELRIVRNVLSHQLTPGRHVFGSTIPGVDRSDEWDLNAWLPGKKLILDPNSLSARHDWLENSIETLRTDIEAFWATHGFR